MLNICEAQQFHIGQSYAGGIIFFIDGSGEHGLVTTAFDQANYVRWGFEGLVGASSLDNGEYNTKIIIQSYKKPQVTAAYICDTLTLGGFKDWYLPALRELRMIYDHQENIRNFTVGEYCSSTESNSLDSWNIHFRPHRRVEFHYDKDVKKYNVRCVRKF